MFIVGLTGKKGAGKTTVAKYFQDAGYQKFAFADTVKELAEHIDPWVGGDFLTAHIEKRGWDAVKWDTPETRTFLQILGNGVRSIDPDYCRRGLLQKINRSGSPDLVVIDDVRYPNEVDVCDIVFRVTGPTEVGGDMDISETGLDDRYFPVIWNPGDESLDKTMQGVLDFVLDLRLRLTKEGNGEV